jgi:5-methylcytosine-specific restriction endonuclease McrA
MWVIWKLIRRSRRRRLNRRRSAFHAPRRVSGGQVTPGMRRTVLARDRQRCVACGSAGPLQVDHVKPRAAGGLSVLSNLRTLCGSCNAAKCDWWPGHTYHGRSPHRARAILAAELRAAGRAA